MKVVSFDYQDRRLVRKFLEFPFKIYKDNQQWVPPLETEARRMLDPLHNPFFKHSEAQFMLALDDSGSVQGRLAVLENRKYNQYNHVCTAFFYLFECQRDFAIAQALFEAAFNWAKHRGLDRIIGPKGFTPLDGFGLLAKGFQHRPALGQPYNPPYYVQMIEKLGFTCKREMVSGYLGEESHFPSQIFDLAERIKQRRGLRVSNFKSRRDLRDFVPKIRALYNQTLAGQYGNIPLSEADAEAMANQMIWFANPRLIKVVEKDEQPVGFMFAYPDISAALQRTRGRLFPLGWIDLLLELRRTKWININGAGMLRGYRGLGGTALLFSEMYKSVADSGYRHADIVQIDIENERMQREMSSIGIDFYKTHRLYERELEY
jgi:GNAT superfamily N-acetyltransferase